MNINEQFILIKFKYIYSIQVNIIIKVGITKIKITLSEKKIMFIIMLFF